MAKQVVTVSIDEDTIKEIDEFAQKMGLSRSAAINMMLVGCVGGSSGVGDTFSQMIKAAAGAKKRKKSENKTPVQA